MMKRVLFVCAMVVANVCFCQKSINVGKIEVFQIDIQLNEVQEVVRIDENGSTYISHEIKPKTAKVFVKCKEKWPQVDCFDLMVAWSTWAEKGIKVTPKWQTMQEFSLMALQPTEKGTFATLVFSLDFSSTMRGVGEVEVKWHEKEQRFKASRGHGIMYKVVDSTKADGIERGSYGASRKFIPSWGSWSMRRVLFSDAQIKQIIKDFGGQK